MVAFTATSSPFGTVTLPGVTVSFISSTVGGCITVATSSLDTAYPLDDASIRRFREDGFIRLPNVLSPETLAEYGPDITRVVDENNRLKDIPFEKRTLYDQAFVQVMNIWTRNQHVRELAFSKRLARIAAELMGTRGVRGKLLLVNA